MATLDAVEHLVGLQSRAPLAHYVGLWSRLESFDPVAAGVALGRGELARTHAMRATIHFFSSPDAWACEHWRSDPSQCGSARRPSPGSCEGSTSPLCVVTREAWPPTLRSAGPSWGEVLVNVSLASLRRSSPMPPPIWSRCCRSRRAAFGANGARLRWQTYRGWLGVEAEAPAIIDEVMLGYLAAFGPASVSDMRSWSGLPALREVADRLTPHPRVFLDENDRGLAR
jgi:hypothetical protein